MRLLVFDVYGFMAHFRRFYSTVTALSYRFPPRNTLAGLLAGIMGMERDSYYEFFSREKCCISLSLRTPVRTVMFSSNYLNIDSMSPEKFRGIYEKEPRTQVALELVLPQPPHDRVNYRVFVYHDDESFMNELWERLVSKRFVYPPSLGPAYCLADVEAVCDARDCRTFCGDDRETPIATVIREDLISPGGFVPSNGLRVLREERLPPDFTGGRSPTGASVNYIFEAEGKPITARIAGEVFEVCLPEGGVFGVFM